MLPPGRPSRRRRGPQRERARQGDPAERRGRGAPGGSGTECCRSPADAAPTSLAPASPPQSPDLLPRLGLGQAGRPRQRGTLSSPSTATAWRKPCPRAVGGKGGLTKFWDKNGLSLQMPLSRESGSGNALSSCRAGAQEGSEPGRGGKVAAQLGQLSWESR